MTFPTTARSLWRLGHFQPTTTTTTTMTTTSFLRNTSSCRRPYFTNGQTTKKNDPYAILGLQWGDGATSADIQKAFRRKAAQLHPDVNTKDSPKVALKKFQALQAAYTSLMKTVTNQDASSYDLEEWRVALWRQSDRIAMDRTDVAGVLRKRPVPPARRATTFGRELGHPTGRGTTTRVGEYLGDNNNNNNTQGKKASSSVGTGRNKWVKPKPFQPWNGGNNNNNDKTKKS